MDLQKSKTRVKQKIYPLIDDMVDAFYNDKTNDLIEKIIENDNDKSVFLMFVMMYYGIYLQLDTKNDDDVKKDQIKMLMNDLIKDPQKRLFCVELLNNFTSKNKTITQNERLFLENKDDPINNNE